MIAEELKELASQDIKTVLAHVNRHKAEAMHFNDQIAVKNADWLIYQLELELIKRKED